jgi:hypothetical protein
MDLFDIDPNALIILVIMIIGALKWAMERLKGAPPAGEGDDDEPATFEDLYEEARREIQARQSHQQETRPSLFKALSPPPPLPAPTPPPLPKKTGAAAKHPPGRSPYEQKAPARTKLTASERAALERLQKEGMSTLRSRRHRGNRGSHSKVRKLLASPNAARDAVVLREILGPPKGAA